LVRRIVWATELLLGMRNKRPNFVVTQSSVIPAQRNRAPPCQIAADAAFLERLKIRLKGAKGVSQQFSTEKFILRLLGRSEVKYVLFRREWTTKDRPLRTSTAARMVGPTSTNRIKEDDNKALSERSPVCLRLRGRRDASLNRRQYLRRGTGQIW
jgi:hypothetical protein